MLEIMLEMIQHRKQYRGVIMRLRYKPWAKEKLEQYPQYVVSSQSN